mmetsp:Transcript_8898/g.10631  ORF Transcript_8898/g.10631 Transcript_8898/m.10631 type:complete len:157 (-) Transcript_8898:147-617(-)
MIWNLFALFFITTVVTGLSLTTTTITTKTTATIQNQNNYLDTLSCCADEDDNTGDIGTLNNHHHHITNISTPNDHYAKLHPMAGWAGYKHSNWGGYLDNLAQKEDSPPNKENLQVVEASFEKEEKESSIFEQHKPANYGNDVRWGAQVYLFSISSS